MNRTFVKTSTVLIALMLAIGMAFFQERAIAHDYYDCWKQWVLLPVKTPFGEVKLIPWREKKCGYRDHTHRDETDTERDERLLKKADGLIRGMVEDAVSGCERNTPGEPEPCLRHLYPSVHENRTWLTNDLIEEGRMVVERPLSKCTPRNVTLEDGTKARSFCWAQYIPAGVHGHDGDIEVNPTKILTDNDNDHDEPTKILVESIIHERLHQRWPYDLDHQTVIDVTDDIIRELFGSADGIPDRIDLDWEIGDTFDVN